jgi:membrane associated rhomboid family serine protease
MIVPLRDHNPTQRFPLITVGLIALNVLVFLRELAAGAEMGFFIARWGATPYELTTLVDLVGRVQGLPLVHVEGPAFLPLTAITSMFLHGGWLHLLFNMHFLWIFGNNVEDFLGPLRFLAFYLVTGLVGLATHVAIDPDSIVPVIGASGAVSGMLGAYVVLYPKARITSLLFLGFFVQFLQVPALLLISVWTALQVLGGVFGLLVPGQSGGVAYWAHIGGLVGGYVLLRWLFPAAVARERLRSRWRQLPGQIDSPDRWR